MTDTTSPSQPSCFVGGTFVLTTRGRLRIDDLARLSDKRDAAAAQYDAQHAQLADAANHKLTAYDSHCSVLLQLAPGLEDALTQHRASLAESLTSQVNAFAAQADEALSKLLPEVYTRDPDSGEIVTRPIVRAWQAKTTTELLEVEIDRVEVPIGNGDNVQEVPITVRCTPEHVFIGPEGETQASELEGVKVYRASEQGVQETYLVPTPTSVQAPDPVAVYDMEIKDIPAFFVAPQNNCCAALVHNCTTVDETQFALAADADDASDPARLDDYVNAIADAAPGEARRLSQIHITDETLRVCCSYRSLTEYEEEHGMPDTGTPLYSGFIHKSRYARWLEDEQRRETWPETVARYFDFFRARYREWGPAGALELLLSEAQRAVVRMEIMPSMRALWAAGPALERCNVTAYNCAYMAVDSPRVFDEAVYVLMSGCGLGFSVERQYINKLPCVAESFHASDTTIRVADSRTGWAKAFKELVSLLYAGQVPQWDLSKLRPQGARLKTSGGRSSGPKPLEELFKFAVALFRGAAGRRLSSIECHDLMCFVGRIVVAGGVRRSAEISLSNPSDDRLRTAKSGQWWHEHGHRALSNNSAAYTERPDFQVFMREWLALYESRSGERGIYNRVAAQSKAAAIGRDVWDFGINPCGEISLRPCEFCNLSEVVIRRGDTLEKLKQKVRLATVLGTLQSSLTDFKYLRKRWATNCEAERLLGVSLTGITDHEVLGDPTNPLTVAWLKQLRVLVRETNVEVAELLGINASVALTTVKPSGTVSQLVNSSSGIHPRFSEHYIRRVRADAKDPLAQFMSVEDFPVEADEMNPSNMVFSFPVKAPEGARLAGELTALQQCELWKLYSDHWADHSVSCTIYFSDDEFLGLGQWVWENFGTITGLSFLPRADHSYTQAPYEAIDEATYNELASVLPESIDWSGLAHFEAEDNTQGQRELACSGGACEVVDLPVA